MNIGIAKGRLYKELECLLKQLDYDQESSRVYTKVSSTGDVCKYVKCRDIPKLVESGSFDLGFVYQEWVEELSADVVSLMKLEDHATSISVISSEDNRTLEQLLAELERPVRVVSEYPNISKKYLNQLNTDYDVMVISGSSEAYVPKFADLAIDCVESGATVRANGLKVVHEIMQCCVTIVANKQFYRTHRDKIEYVLQIIDGYKWPMSL